MNCKECPFRTGPQVQGEGSRILKEWDEELVSAKGLKYKRHHIERDNLGQYDVVVVAMAPAREEIEQGRVLVGASGQILRRHLESMEVDEYYLCNVLLCPISKDENYEENSGDVSTAMECCRDVAEEVGLHKPKLVIALGDMPYRKFAPDTASQYGIKEIEGRVIPSKVGNLLPLSHPAYYWRHPDQIFDFTECLRSGIRVIEGNYTQAGEPTRELVTSDNLGKALNDLARASELAVDTETTGFFAYGWEPDRLLEMGISRPPYDHAYIVPARMIPEFKELLETIPGVYWNASFDCSFLKQIGISPLVGYDGMLAHYSLDERSYSHGLKRCAKLYLGCDDWEKDIDKYIPGRAKKTISYEVIPTDVRHEYLSKDVTRTGLMKKAMEGYINEKIFNTLLMPACRMFVEVRHRGIKIDPLLLMEMEGILTEDIDKLEVELRNAAGTWINARSYNDVSTLVYETLKIPMDPFFGRSTSKNFLEQFEETDPIIKAILDIRNLTHTRGHYIEQFARYTDHNFRIHPEILTHRAVTGRLSSEAPNIMNIKRDSKLKSMFLPDRCFGYGDIKGNELRWYGIRSGDQDVLDAFERGEDPHQLVSVAAYGEARAKEMRPDAKAVVFGRLYQRTRASISRQVGEEATDRVMEAVDSIFPGVGRYYKEIMQELKKGYLTSYFGRKRRFSLITPESRKSVEREAVNFPIQSAGSDIMLLGLLHLWENRKKWDIFPCIPVHDSIAFDMPNPEPLMEIKKELEDFSYELVKGKCPFVWEMDWGLDLSLRKNPLNPYEKKYTDHPD